ncbi:hypothetical protein L1887_12466 [Cichorium endivia]|nr:hypothetical protein L1887_12466 [Cichorium endivia]
MLQRTFSIHHLKSNEWVDSTIFVSENVNSEEFTEIEPYKDDTTQVIENSVDISEKSKINKDVFPRILQDGSRVSLTKAKLTKSGSFPFVLGSRNSRPTKLKHKLNEFYAVSKTEKGLDNWERNLNLAKLGSLMVELDKQGGKNLDYDLDNGNIMPIRRICSFNELANGLCNDFYSLPIEEEGDHQKTQEINQLNPVIVPECSSQEESHQLELQISEGLKPLCALEEDAKNNIKSVNAHDHNAAYFNYLREILEQSGFIKNGLEQTWYSSNQLLNPLVFQEIESQYLHDPEYFEVELIEPSHRLHLFEVIDETLLKMYGRSFSYYPKALSYSCKLSSAPRGKFVLEEVTESVSRLIDLRLDKDQFLESIVSWDFRLSDDWMNLQMESKCIALELEDMILNELLGEVLCS